MSSHTTGEEGDHGTLTFPFDNKEHWVQLGRNHYYVMGDNRPCSEDSRAYGSIVEGNILGDSDYPVNRAGFVIHSALHMARPDAHAIMHTHTNEGVAVSAQEHGLLPLSMPAIGLIAGRSILATSANGAISSSSQAVACCSLC